MSCNPSGSPSLFNPAGTDIPGKPARLTVTVKTSFKYISTGSVVSNFPSSKAADGVVGQVKRLQLRKVERGQGAADGVVGQVHVQ